MKGSDIMSYKERLAAIDLGIEMVLKNMFKFGDLTPKENMEILRKLIMRIPPHDEEEKLIKNEFLDFLAFYAKNIERLQLNNEY